MAHKGTSKYTKESPKVRRQFADILRDVPTEQFVRMVAKSGLPANEAKELCRAFKELKR